MVTGGMRRSGECIYSGPWGKSSRHLDNSYLGNTGIENTSRPLSIIDSKEIISIRAKLNDKYLNMKLFVGDDDDDKLLYINHISIEAPTSFPVWIVYATVSDLTIVWRGILTANPNSECSQHKWLAGPVFKEEPVTCLIKRNEGPAAPLRRMGARIHPISRLTYFESSLKEMAQKFTKMGLLFLKVTAQAAISMSYSCYLVEIWP